MDNLSSAINSLLETVKTEKLSAFDVAQELSNLSRQVSELEKANQNLTNAVKQLEKELLEANEKNSKVQNLLTRERELEKENTALQQERSKFEQECFRFDIEKTYMQKEVINMKEILSAILARKEIDENYYGGTNGANWSRYERTWKPGLEK